MTPPRRGAADAATAWEALFRAQVAVMRRLAADDAWDELSMKEYDVLFTLSRCPTGGLRLKDLNREVLLSQPSLSRLVDRLVARGLVERQAVADDLRGTRVVLTDAGRTLQKQVGRRHVATIDETISGALDPAELAELERLCDRLRAHVSDAPTPVRPAPTSQEDLP